MAYQQHLSRSRVSGPVRNGQHRTGIHPATYDMTLSSAHGVDTTHGGPFSSDLGQGASGNQYNYPQQLADSDFYASDYSYDVRHSETRHMHYSEVPRAWRSPQREAFQALPLQRNHTPPVTYERTHNYTERAHQVSSPSRQQQHPLPTEEEHRRNRSSHQPLEDRRPLGMSNLRQLNQSRSPMHAMDKRQCEFQRDGPYDGIQYVGRRSDYEPYRDQG